ncbi:MAG: hybrid sensor histidine kinase/response regulator [Proteobacteria bacterium]|nr:hybrid sensor histidine kinase/response regulator [Pseudomonadota bacterium]
MPQPPANSPLVLVVDDEPTQRLLFCEGLLAAGCRVEEAEDGQIALARIKSARPDLIVSDAIMPALDGFDLCAAIRQDPALSDIPVLMVTGLEDDASIERAYAAGANDFVVKPVNWTLLGFRVKFLLRSVKTELDLRSAKQRAEAAAIAKTQFLANMSHELRTPLNAVIGFSEMMTGEVFGSLGDARYLDYAKDINEAGHRLLGIISNILDLVKVEAGGIELREDIVSLDDIVAAAARDIAGAAEQSGVSIAVDVERGLPRISGDAGKLQQVVLHLLSNAVKFTKPGGRIAVGARLGERDGLVLSVRDTGIGIPQDALHRIFEPFFQVDTGLNRQFDGAGLGLPLVSVIVKRHGGDVRIESQLGTGTTVTVRLPKDRTMAARLPTVRL